MAEQILPAVLRMRAERILRKSIKIAYKIEDSPNIVRCVLHDDNVKYVDFSTNKEVTPLAEKEAVDIDLVLNGDPSADEPKGVLNMRKETSKKQVTKTKQTKKKK